MGDGEIVWDRLMRVGPDGLAQPWAAEKVERPDATTVNITLRKGMTWSDGQPVTIDDAVFSLQAPGYADKAPMYKPFVQNIASVEATGPDTLTIKLKRPDAAFLVSSLSKLNLAAKHIWQPIFDDLKDKPQTAESIMEQHPVSSGPFRIARASLNQEIVLEANPDHWSHPKIHRWIMRIMPNVEASVGALKSGEINFLSDYTGDPELLKDVAKSNPNIEVSEALDLGFKFIALAIERRPPFDNLAFRQALSAVIDRKLLAEDAWAARRNRPIHGSRRHSQYGMTRGSSIACLAATWLQRRRSCRTRVSWWSAARCTIRRGKRKPPRRISESDRAPMQVVSPPLAGGG